MTDEIPIEALREGTKLNLNKSRMRAVYYRQVFDKQGNGEWVPTTPLPADLFGQMQYFGKGFRAKPPVESTKVTTDEVSCPYCEFKPKSAFGLQSHLRTHIKKEE